MPTPDEILAAYDTHKSNSAASAALGMDRTHYRRTRLKILALRGEAGGPPVPQIGKPPEGFEVHRNSAEYDKAGNLSKQWVGTKRAPGDVFEALPGHVVKGESALVDADGRVMQRWVKTSAGDGGASLVDALKAAFEGYEGKAPVIAAPSMCDDDLVTVYPIPDLHFGMYAWGAETGADYDTQIAADITMSSIGALVAQSKPSAHAVVLVLGDFFHQNDQKNVTPGSGHRLDVDGRWARVYRNGAKLLVDVINLVATKHHSVTVKVLQGNHDTDAAPTLSVAIEFFFSANERIAVDTSPRTAWYYRFGRTMFGAHHGHEMRKFITMAMTMAVDRAKDWGQTAHRYYYSGHIHHREANEVMGVECESFPSPAAKDSWNAGSGYRAGRGFTAITLHREFGEIGRHNVKIPEQVGEAA